jgi:uncharacterized protein (TIGR03435 family)
MFTLKRRLYQLILRLHPTAFRNRFAREMSLDFEDALATYGFSRLFADATHSLLRQWATPVFSPSREQTPIPSHPLLAGHYMPLTDAPLTPFELLRGSLLFAVLLFMLSLAFNARTNHSITRNLQGLPANQNTAMATAAAGAFQIPYNANYPRSRTLSSGNSSASGTAYIPAGILVPGVRGPLAVSPGKPSPAPHFSWIALLLPCIFISVVIWIASLLLRRTQRAALRVGIVSLSLLAIVAAAAFLPVQSPPAHAQARPEFHATPVNSNITPELLLFHPATSPSYEVATIKPIDPNTADGMVRLPPGVPNGLSPLSIRRYIMDAYGAIYAAQIVGGPDWLSKDSYQITGKLSGDDETAMRSMTGADAMNQKRAMQQSLLADRFHLKAHFETRVLPVYELVPAKGGLKIAAVPAPPEHKAGDLPRPLIHVSPGNLPPGSSVSTMSSGVRITNARAIPMQMFARGISFDAATELEPRPIVDHTGFIGYFDIKDLTWAPLSPNATETGDAPFFQRALEEQLGIKIQPTDAPIEVLVIDSIDRPSEN